MRTQLAQVFSKETALIHSHITNLNPNITYRQEVFSPGVTKQIDGTSSQTGTETLQRLREISQWSPSACSLILPTVSSVLCQMFAASLTCEASLAM